MTLELGRRLLGAQIAQGVLHVHPFGRREGGFEGGHDVGPDQPPAAQAHPPGRGRPADVGHRLGEALDPGVGIVLVGVGQLAQDPHVGDATDHQGVLVALRPNQHHRLALAGHEYAGGFEMDREVGQPAGVSRPERGPVVGVRHQEVEIRGGHHGLDPAPALRVFGRGDVRSRSLFHRAIRSVSRPDPMPPPSASARSGARPTARRARTFASSTSE